MVETINIEVPDDLYQKLLKIKGKSTWLELFQDIVDFDSEINWKKKK